MRYCFCLAMLNLKNVIFSIGLERRSSNEGRFHSSTWGRRGHKLLRHEAGQIQPRGWRGRWTGITNWNLTETQECFKSKQLNIFGWYKCHFDVDVFVLLQMTNSITSHKDNSTTADDTDENQSMFASFTSASPRYLTFFFLHICQS